MSLHCFRIPCLLWRSSSAASGTRAWFPRTPRGSYNDQKAELRSVPSIPEEYVFDKTAPVTAAIPPLRRSRTTPGRATMGRILR